LLQAPPEHPACSQVGSVLPPSPTVSSSHTCFNREPELAAEKVTTTPDNKSESSSSNNTNHGSDSQHFSHPFLGTYEVHQFLDLGYLEGTHSGGGI